MSKSLKFSNSNYLDSTSIVHKKELLSNKVIYDSGSNSSGKWIRFEDGTMICYHIVTPDTQNTEYHYYSCLWSFPQAFAETPFVFSSPKSWKTALISTKSYPENIYYSKVMVQALNLASTSLVYDDTCEVNVIAIGKWK